MKNAVKGAAPVVRWLAVLILVAPGVEAQDRPLPASPTPPREELARQRAQLPTTPAASPTIDQLLQQLRLTRAEIERRKAAPGTPLGPSPQEPPEEQERRRVVQPPAPTRSPTFQELLDVLRRQPGGPEVLDRARRGGAQIPPAPEMGSQSSLGEFAFGGGFVQVEWPFDAASTEAKFQATMLKVTRNANTTGAVPNLGHLTAYAHMPQSLNYSSIWGPLTRSSGMYSSVGSYDVRSFMQISLHVAAAGYYLINVVAKNIAAAELRKETAGAYPVVSGGQWTNSLTGTYQSYPVVLNLAAGYHFLYWIPTKIVVSAYVSEISLTKL